MIQLIFSIMNVGKFTVCIGLTETTIITEYLVSYVTNTQVAFNVVTWLECC